VLTPQCLFFPKVDVKELFRQSSFQTLISGSFHRYPPDRVAKEYEKLSPDGGSSFRFSETDRIPHSQKPRYFSF